jgi:hypothetical protein
MALGGAFDRSGNQVGPILIGPQPPPQCTLLARALPHHVKRQRRLLACRPFNNTSSMNIKGWGAKNVLGANIAGRIRRCSNF